VFRNKLWHQYVWMKQSLSDIADATKRSHVWVRKQLDAIDIPVVTIKPQPTILIADTTFWGRRYGVCVFRSANLRQNIWWNEVDGERMAHYRYGRKILEEKGWQFTAAVVDGRRGLTAVFHDIPVQLCLFHQMKQVTKYLTRRPQSDAGKELRALTLTLSKTTEAEFTQGFEVWRLKWESYAYEKTENFFVTGRNKSYYTHDRVRHAYESLKRNLPYLFTYEQHSELNIPKTTNSLDGFFSALKKRLGVHHGLRRDRRFKVISAILKGRT
jgi:hypothetical protein